MKITSFVDPIHGGLPFFPHEIDLINTRPFQRLRRIRQLGGTHLVFPGAVHDRFQHSLGTCHLAGRLAQQVGLHRRRIEEVRLAALLHDIGHGPFSHVSEHVMLEAVGDAVPGLREIHPLISRAIVEQEVEVRRALGRWMDGVAEILSDGVSVERDIVAGEVDADRLDYLCRDVHFTGIDVPNLDLDQIVAAAGTGMRCGHERLAFPSGVRAEVLAIRRSLQERIYRTPERVAVDVVLERILRLGLMDRLRVATAAGAPSFAAEWLRRFLELDDFSSLLIASRSADPRVTDLVQRYEKRDLPLPFAAAKIKLEPARLQASHVARCDERLAEACGAKAEAHLFAIHVDSRWRPTYRLADEHPRLPENEVATVVAYAPRSVTRALGHRGEEVLRYAVEPIVSHPVSPQV